MMSLAIAVMMLVFALPALATPVCYRYIFLDFPTPAGVRGVTNLAGVNLTKNQIVGNYANQEPPDGFRLRPTSPAGTSFTLTRYGAIPEGQTIALTLNDQGDRAGTITLGPGRRAGFIKKIDGVLEIFEVPGATSTNIFGINNKRDKVGSFNAAGDNRQHGLWVWKGQYLTRDHPDGISGTYLMGINSHQRIVGWYDDGLRYHGLDLTAGIFTTLNAPGFDNTLPRAINDFGDIVGFVSPSDQYGRAVLYKGGVWYDATPPFAGLIESAANGITNDGKFVGSLLAVVDGQEVQKGFVALPQSTCTSTSTVLPPLTE